MFELVHREHLSIMCRVDCVCSNIHAYSFAFVVKTSTDNFGICPFNRGYCVECFCVRDSDDLRAGLHGLRHGDRPKEGQGRDSCTALHWVGAGRKHSSWWGVRRRLIEPGGLVRAGPGELGLDEPLGLLGWAPDWWWHSRCCLRVLIHQPHPRATSQLGALVWWNQTWIGSVSESES